MIRARSLLLLAVGLTVVACGNPGPAGGEGPAMGQGPPTRIVSLSPAITEILFELGQGDRVVGVTTGSDWPPAASRVTRVGPFGRPDLEAILRLGPDLVIMPSAFSAFTAVGDRLRGFHVPVLEVEDQTLEQVLGAVIRIGEATGAVRRARELVEGIRSTISALRARLGPGVRGAKVLLVYGWRPLVIGCEGTYGADLLHALGLADACDGGRGYVKVSMERILAMAPEIIIDGSDGPGEQRKVMERWAGWRSVPAVASGRVYAMPQVMMRPGPRLGRAAEALVGLVGSGPLGPVRPAPEGG